MSVSFHCDACHGFLRYCLSIHNRVHLHAETVHRNGGSSRLIIALFNGDVVMGASSAHHAVCAPVSE